ncbi:hypothetical protein ACS0TY_021145 [Phlomoides rotata]
MAAYPDGNVSSPKALQTWNLGKELGITACCPESLILNKISELSSQDKIAKGDGQGEEHKWLYMKIISINIRGLGNNIKKKKIQEIIQK